MEETRPQSGIFESCHLLLQAPLMPSDRYPFLLECQFNFAFVSVNYNFESTLQCQLLCFGLVFSFHLIPPHRQEVLSAQPPHLWNVHVCEISSETCRSRDRMISGEECREQGPIPGSGEQESQ